MKKDGYNKADMKKTLSIVLPCHNELTAIPSMMDRLFRLKESLSDTSIVENVEILIVDDGSTDGSIEALQTYKEIRLLRHEQRRGYGAALKTGFKYCAGEHICFLDLDDTYPPEKIQDLYLKVIVEKLDMLTAVRLFNAQGMSAVRGGGNWFFTCLSNLITSSRVTDACSGFRIFNRRILPFILEIKNTDLSFALEMSLLFNRPPFKSAEMPIPYNERTGRSKLSVFSDGFRFLFLIIKTLLLTQNRFPFPKNY